MNRGPSFHGIPWFLVVASVWMLGQPVGRGTRVALLAAQSNSPDAVQPVGWALDDRSETEPKTLCDWTGYAGWTVAAIGWGDVNRLLPGPDGDGAWRELHVERGWPGMRFEPDEGAVAAAGRSGPGWGAAALAAMGLVLLATRRW